MNANNLFSYIDLFAGIGGFHLAIHALGGKCVFASENNNFARRTYEYNIKKISPNLFKLSQFKGGIILIDPSCIPNFDLLCAGFPCQPFSQAGYKKGFQDKIHNRGNLSFEIVKIIEVKRPRAFFLENVRGLLRHDEGRTLNTIRTTLENLGYSFYYKIIKGTDHGLPQHRARLFMVGFKGEKTISGSFKFPKPMPLTMTMSDIFGRPCARDIGFTLRVGGRGSGLHDRRNWDTYEVEGKPVVLTHVEAKKMQGFPADFFFPVSETQAMKQLGNSVAIPAIKATADSVINYMNRLNS